MRYQVNVLKNGDVQVWDNLMNECIATFHNPSHVPEMTWAKSHANQYAAAQNSADQGRMAQISPLLAGIDETVHSVEAGLAYWVNR